MKLKTILKEYEMPDEFWDRLEKILEIETREAYERGCVSSTQDVPKRFDNPKSAYAYLKDKAKEGETIIVDERANIIHPRTISRFTKDTKSELCILTGKKGYVKEEDCHCFCCGDHKGRQDAQDTQDALTFYKKVGDVDKDGNVIQEKSEQGVKNNE